nr:hypothetical protein [Tanacetum cinerariifolium]
MEIAALHIDGKSIDVDAPPDIIDVVDEGDDIIDEEDLVPHDLADSDDEDLINLDIDDGVNMSHGVIAAITDKSGPVPIWFEIDNRETFMPLGDHAAHWANYLGELHLQKIYNGKKAALKEKYWVPEEYGGYDLECIRRGRPSHVSEADWDAQLAFWNDHKNLARAMETSATREYPSLIHTFFLTYTVGGVFLNLENKALYAPTPPRVCPTLRMRSWPLFMGASNGGMVIPPPSQSTHFADIARLKKREKLPTKQVNLFMRLFRSDDKFSQMLTQLKSQSEFGGGNGSGGCEDDEPGDDEDGDEDEEEEDDS